ncbi:LPS-assembly protein LptD [Verminephrobacter aporrectodeae subsp. tuberculatae]|uniref:LPS-assembly protein LptD n=1 Tax=Verminephrobacter aporrectodeae TaxID=1110389 RepID=UPI0022371D1F|nr:LPS-assembly protein LptD [Verminephrobacter aporrectodeae]MCW5257850.1 LPS-assembly protein LptD [Verminephrobacter aporrectodeae subsp. tuberculatae]
MPPTAQTPCHRAASAWRLSALLPALARGAALACCALPHAALAQEPAQGADAPDAPPALRATPRLQERIPPAVRHRLPIFVTGEHIRGQIDLNTIIEGDAQLRHGDTVIRADRMDYTAPDDLARAHGRVRINRAGDRYEGTELELYVDAFQGFFSDAQYWLLEPQAHGTASRMDFLARDRTLVHNATYTTCERGDAPDWAPDWVLRAATLHIDSTQETGTAEDAVLEFKGVPLLPLAYISFPLSDKRKSGLLPPTVGLDSRDGLTYTQPYYWNIAPNRDATLRATLMQKRGASLGGEFRYLEPAYAGQISGDLMPSDQLRRHSRWSFSGRHQGAFSSSTDTLGLNLNLNRVSDDDYWRDFGRASGPLRQRLLPNDALLTWTRSDTTTTLRTLKWQTLQDVNAPIVPPYDRMPQLQWRYVPLGLGGNLDASVELDSTRFQAARERTGQPNATRSYAMAQISRPFVQPAGYVTPRLQLHATQYQFDAPLPGNTRSAQRALPTFSLDSALMFERDTRFFGRAFLQTLEPRAFYTYTPYRDQSRLPVYDSAANDFNLATIYTENAYGGNDRLADNNLLTLGVTTRLLDPESGNEAIRLGLAQRLRLSEQRVTLPGNAPVNERLSDLLLGASIRWTPRWDLDSMLQYNPKQGRSVRTTVGARYSPGSYRTLSAAYRRQRGTSEQIDIGWQWPLNDLWGDKGQDLGPGGGQGGRRWYGVGRLNYSLQDSRLINTIVGLEYDGCCWIGSVVLERLQNGTSTSNTRLLLQIEFLGLSRLSLGANPQETFKHNVPRYQYLREQVAPPSRFSNYD